MSNESIYHRPKQRKASMPQEWRDLLTRAERRYWLEINRHLDMAHEDNLFFCGGDRPFPDGTVSRQKTKWQPHA